MYPDLLSVFGLRLYGIAFERVLWVLGCILMLWGVYSSAALIRGGKRMEGLVQGGVVLLVLGWFGMMLYRSTIGAQSYTLFLSHEVTLHTYAVCILVGVILGVWLATRSAARDGLSAGSMFNLCLLLLLAGFLGARLAHVVLSAPEYYYACVAPEKLGLAQRDCLRFFKFWEGGLTFYGGFIGGVVVLLVYRHLKSVSILRLMDILAPSLALAHAFGRIGCLAAGCCWGAVNHGHIGLIFGPDSFAYAALSKAQAQGDLSHAADLAAGHTPLLHATQLYEAFGELALFFVLIVLLARRRRYGVVIATWLMGYGAWRIFTECMRGDVERGYFFELKCSWLNNLLNLPADHATFLSTSQGIGLVMICIGAVLVWRGRKEPAQGSVAEGAPAAAPLD